MSELVWSENEIKKFVTRNFPNGLQPNEVAFVSASVRNKYLTAEEREFFHLGRSEMFNRKIVRNLDFYIETVVQLSEQLHTYKTKHGQQMPNQAAVIYANIHPSDSLGAYAIFNEQMQKELIAIAKNQKQDMASLRKMDTLVKNAYQKASGTKAFLDIDFDIPPSAEQPVYEFVESLQKNSVTYYIICTKSGYHIQLLRETIQYNFHEVIHEIQKRYPDYEIVINKNAMVPVPGTLQAGYKVHYVI